MKKYIFSMFCIFVCAAPAFAAPLPPTGYPPALEQTAPAALPPVDYISPDAVTLTDREKKALQLSDDWARRNVEPVLTPGGKIVYVHGATLPTIVAVPYQVCDVELEPGETVNEIVVGDSARWKPERVYDDGRQVFIRLPDSAGSGEMPVLLVRKGKQNVLVNYRVREGAMIVDGVFDHIALVLGVGGEQEKVDIMRLKTGKGGK